MRNHLKRLHLSLIMLLAICLLPFAVETEAAGKAVKKVLIYQGKKNISKKTITLQEGKSQKIKVKITPSSAKKSISYKSSNSKIVSVRKGVLKAQKSGKCKITVTVKGKNGKKKTCWIKLVVKKKTSKTSTSSTQKKTTTTAKKQLQILMIGNSYTYYNNLNKLIEEKIDAKVTVRAVGGATLAEHCETFFDDDTGKATLALLNSQKWDYVILQEQSRTPVDAYNSFSYGAEVLCQKIRAQGGKPVLYGTWAYKTGSTYLQQTGYSHAQMYQLLHQAFLQVSDENQMILADVGTAFYQKEASLNLYASDGSHPSLEGSRLAAEILAQAIRNDMK